jgi:serine/threonine-protein kinase
MRKLSVSRLSDDDPVSSGQLIGKHYRVQNEVLGKGGMGIVVLAQDERDDSLVAIKLIHSFHQDEQGAARFFREIHAMRKIDSPYVMPVLDFGTVGRGEPFMVMPFFSGNDLGKIPAFLKDKVSIHHVVRWMLQVCKGVAAAHAAGIIHRDLKPANIFVTSDDSIRVLDFGISKVLDVHGLTRTNQGLSTPGYAPLEQIDASRDVDERCDIFAIGATFFKLLTGKFAFGDSPVEQVTNMAAGELPLPITTLRPDVPSELEKIIVRCLMRSPNDRYRTIVEVIDDLSNFVDPLVFRDRPSIALVDGSNSEAMESRASTKSTELALPIGNGEAAQTINGSTNSPVSPQILAEGSNSATAPPSKQNLLLQRFFGPILIVILLVIMTSSGSLLGYFFAIGKGRSSDSLSKSVPVAPPTPVPKPNIESTSALNDAYAEFDRKDYERAHRKILELPETSPDRGDPRAIEIEAAWADSIFRKVEQVVDSAEKRELAKQIIATLSVDAERRKKAADILREIEARESLAASINSAKIKPAESAVISRVTGTSTVVAIGPAVAPSPGIAPVPVGLMDEDAKRRALEPKVWSGKASVDEIRMLKATCAHLQNRECRDRAGAILKKKLEQE